MSEISAQREDGGAAIPEEGNSIAKGMQMSLHVWRLEEVVIFPSVQTGVFGLRCREYGYDARNGDWNKLVKGWVLHANTVCLNLVSTGKPPKVFEQKTGVQGRSFCRSVVEGWMACVG